MNENRQLKKIFRLIDAQLWEYVEAPWYVLKQEQGKTDLEKRAERIGAESKRLQKIIDAYIEGQTAMMLVLITDERFAKYPLPTPQIGLRKRILSRIAVWKAIRALRKRG